MRLVDADALETDVQNCIMLGSTAFIDKYEVLFRLHNAPTIDAVPVVRCKECKYHEQEQPGMVYCPAVVGGWVEDEWFCRGGERKDDV